MDDQDEGDEGYSDDDLDALPGHAFDELQENAVRSTQQPVTRANLPPLKHQLRLEHAGVASAVSRLSVGRSAGQGADQQLLPPPSSDYGDFDDEMLDGEVLDGDVINVADQSNLLAIKHNADVAGRRAGENTQREAWRQQRYGGSQSNLGVAKQPVQEQAAVNVHSMNGFVPHGLFDGVQAREPIRLESPEYSNQAPQPNADIKALQAHIQKVCSNSRVLESNDLP